MFQSFFTSSKTNQNHPKQACGGLRYDVIVVGAGPVGSLLTCLLGSQGLRVLVLEKRLHLPAHSMAIGITPPSLQVFSKLNLTAEFLRRGVCVRECFIHGESGYLGKVNFRGIPSEHPFILSLQQSATVSILQGKLSEFPLVTARYGAEVMQVQQSNDAASVTFSTPDDAAPQTVEADFVVGCDGGRSQVRNSTGLRGKGRRYRQHFVMADFADDSRMGNDAHLFFTAQGSVESFPLPKDERRWIVQTDSRLDAPPPGFVSSMVKMRTGMDLPAHLQLNQSSFTPRWFNCERYYDGRIILCGDAAHGMSPIGGQGMNTGFADAEFLAGALGAVLQRGQDSARLLAAYNHYRRKAASSAISRAAWGMMLGTWQGRPLSLFRDFIIRHILCKGPVARRMGPFYAMLTIPYHSLQHVPLEELRTAAA